MAYKRKRSYNRRTSRKRPRYARRMRRSGVSRSRINNNVHHFKRSFQGTAITASAAGGNPQALYFTFNMLPNYTEFTNLFDMYRVNFLVLKLVPSITGADGNPSASSIALPNIHSALDYDDSTVPTDVPYLLQYSNHRMTRGHQIHKRAFRPAIDLDVSGLDASAPKWKQWINLATVTCAHRGVKLYVEQAFGVGVGALTYNVYWDVYFSCKGLR